MLRLALALLVILAAGASAEDADWPQWRGPNRDGATVGVAVPSTWPKSLKQLWEVKIGEGMSSPVVVSNQIYVHSRKREDEVVSCLSASDGRLIWSGNYPAPWKVQPGAGDDKGPHSTPTVKDGRVFTLGINGVLTCWDAAAGAVNWRCTPPGRPAEIIPQYGASLSPLVYDGLVLSHGRAALSAYNVATGDIEWSWRGAPLAYASPILVEMAGQRQIVLLTESSLVGLTPADGKTLWIRKLRPRNSFENIITPVRYKDLIIYSQQGYWDIVAVRVTRNGDATKVEEVWRNKDHPLSQCTPIVVGDLLLGLSIGKDGHLFCADAATGKNLWETGSHLQSEVPLVNAGSVVLVVTKGIRLTMFRPNRERYDRVAEWRGPQQAIIAGPVFLGDRILLRDYAALRMLALTE